MYAANIFWKDGQKATVVHWREAMGKSLSTLYHSVPFTFLTWAPTLLPVLLRSSPQRESSAVHPELVSGTR